MTERRSQDGGVTRLSFLKSSAGVAAGAAMFAVPAAVAQAEEKAGLPVAPSSPNPPEPVVAYVRDAARGEVTVMSGTREKTYRDRALAKRLMAAAPKAPRVEGGGI